MGSEERNLGLVDRWRDAYNAGSGFVEVCYHREAVVDCPGALLIKGHKAFKAVEDLVCEAAPKRRMHVDRTIAKDDVVVVQATLKDPDRGDAFESRFLALLTFGQDGLITNDTTYLDLQSWPMAPDATERLAGLDVEWAATPNT
jgi:hypothetical protein